MFGGTTSSQSTCPCSIGINAKNIIIGETLTLGIVFGIIVFILAFACIGFFSNRMGLKLFGYGLALLQVLLLSFLLYLFEIGSDVSGLLLVNFRVLFVLSFGIAMVTLTLFTLRLMNPSDDLEDGDRKWR